MINTEFMPQKPKFNLKPIDITNKKIGLAIREIRKKKGLTQQELADIIGISRTLESHYEIGRLRINGEMVARFALALEVSADEILGINKR